MPGDIVDGVEATHIPSVDFIPGYLEDGGPISEVVIDKQHPHTVRAACRMDGGR